VSDRAEEAARLKAHPDDVARDAETSRVILAVSTPAPTPSETARENETQAERVLSILAHFPGNWRVSAHDSSGNRAVDFGDVGRLRVALRAAAVPVRATQGEPEPIIIPPDVDALDMLDLSAEITYALDRVAREEITANKAAELVIDYVKRTLADKDTDEGELDDEY
jgi:hypothetical protein